MKMYGADLVERPYPEQRDEGAREPYRSEVRRDSARVVHSACFRRLQGKTQLFPANDFDFFRNRLTHSLEVGQVAKSIAYRLNHQHAEWLRDVGEIDPDLCELAGWCHDLGHPPFGHAGEERLDHYMLSAGGFEGNAQTLRLLTRLEKKIKDPGTNDSGAEPSSQKDGRWGLNLTYRTLAAILKYDNRIADRRKQQGKSVEKGHYGAEHDLVVAIQKKVAGGFSFAKGTFKTVECGIMDLADDIAYSTYDLEDAFKGGFMNPLELLSTPDDILEVVADKTMRRVRKRHQSELTIDIKDVRDQLHRTFRSIVKTEDGASEEKQRSNVAASATASRNAAANGYHRTALTSALIGLAIRDIELTPNERNRSGQGLSA